MTEQQKRKQAIRAFMQAHYTDERLAQLLAHAQDGKLFFGACCCFIGIPTADHALSDTNGFVMGGSQHYMTAKALPGALVAEGAYNQLWIFPGSDYKTREEIRRRVLIPMIRAEQRRRERLAQVPEFRALGFHVSVPHD